MRNVMFALALAMLVMAQPANASWQLVPGQPFDGWSCSHRGCKEPCWSAATSRCSWEAYRAERLKQLPKKGTR